MACAVPSPAAICNSEIVSYAKWCGGGVAVLAICPDITAAHYFLTSSMDTLLHPGATPPSMRHLLFMAGSEFEYEISGSERHVWHGS